jgi:hypothetical protein
MCGINRSIVRPRSVLPSLLILLVVFAREIAPILTQSDAARSRRLMRNPLGCVCPAPAMLCEIENLFVLCYVNRYGSIIISTMPFERYDCVAPIGHTAGDYYERTAGTRTGYG